LSLGDADSDPDTNLRGLNDMTQGWTCACCGYMTQVTDGDGCPVCFWECSHLDIDCPDTIGGPNGTTTLRQAQENFRRYGACNKTEVDTHSSVEDRAAGYLIDPDWKPLSLD